MRDAGIGRVLVASLHQGISDILPTRLGFYESWLHSKGLRDGTIGLAPVNAVLSFLRQEEDDAYDRITRRAGEYAAEWTVDTMPSFKRTAIRSAPAWLRARLLLRIARRLVRDSCRASRATATVREGRARINLHSSIFCAVREPVGRPLCGFYAAAFTRLMMIFNLEAAAAVVSCRGAGAASCVLTIPLSPEGWPDAQEAAAR